MEESGYSLVGYFILSQNSWIDSFYDPLEKQFSPLLERHNNLDEVKNIVEDQKEEIRLYKKFKNYYSYGFYIAQKI